MAYLVLESSVRTHRKFLAAGPAASWLWVCGLGYCQEGLTDGFIPATALDFLGVKGAAKLADKLVLSGLWDVVEGGWEVHGYLEHNKSADQVRDIMRRRSEGGKRGGRPRKTLEVGPSETLEVTEVSQTSETFPETLSGTSVLPTDPSVLPRKRAEAAPPIVNHGRCYPGPACERGVCLPLWLGANWVRQFGGDPAAADRQVQAFVAAELKSLAPGPLGMTPREFWEGRWKARHAKRDEPSRGPVTPDAEATRALLREVRP